MCSYDLFDDVLMNIGCILWSFYSVSHHRLLSFRVARLYYVAVLSPTVSYNRLRWTIMIVISKA